MRNKTIYGRQTPSVVLGPYALAGVLVAMLTANLLIFETGHGKMLLKPARQSSAVSLQVVNRSSKGDRLTEQVPAGAPRETRIKEPVVSRPVKSVTFRREPLPQHPPTTVQKRPVGCDPLFSPMASPLLSHLSGRCIS
jgi:hypothetical protein